MDRYLGTKLDGRYLVDKLIGEGGMANVYRGTDLDEERTVAIKILKDEYRGNDELMRRFNNEGRAISVLNHPNIVKVFDVGVSPDSPYIVMEFISGITLKEYIEQRGEPLTYKEVVHFTNQVLQAIQHAHDKGIVHRDIKPQNIMILESGNVKVMDFGIARLARSEIHTANEQAIGSVHYISPEQAQGADTDPRADIYSVGIMMYEMLTGRLPFEDESAVQVAIKQISHDAVPVKQANPSVPEGLSEITMKAMVKQPRLRYQSAIDMMRDIEEFKVNPGIRFGYDYLLEDDAAGRVMANGSRVNGNGAARANGRPAVNGKKRKPKKAKRKKRIGLLMPIIFGLTIAVVGICVVYGWDIIQNSGIVLFGEYEEIGLPDFTGMNIDDVKQMVRSEPYRNIRLDIREEHYEDQQVGKVMRQNPASSNDNMKIVKENQMVRLVVSSGVQMYEVPNLAGMTKAEAIEAVLAAGITPYAVPEASSTVPTGKVTRTEPEQGFQLPIRSNTILTIYYSSEAREFQRIVPSVMNLSLEEAQTVLETVNLGVGEIRSEFSAEPEGTVLNQYPLPGGSATVADLVNIWVSKGPEPPPPEPEPEYVPPPTPPAPTTTPPTPSATDPGSTPSVPASP